MDTLVLFFVVVMACLVGLLGIAVGMAVAQGRLRRQSADGADQLSHAVDGLRRDLQSQQAEEFRRAVDAMVSVASSQLGDQLAAGKMVIDREHEVVATKVSGVETELRRVGDLVSSLQKERAEQAGQFSTGLEQAMNVTSALAETTSSLRHALASPKARGQWGERMAEDVLRSVGFLEGTNYLKQTKLASGGVPDYTFPLPGDHVVHMDVKFPIDNYLRWLETEDAGESARLVKSFQRDVRDRVKELTGRSYVEPGVTVDYLLLFIPNESVYGFLHEHDPDLIDFAISQQVVLCSPTTLFAVLAVIRQAMDNFLVDQRSHEILAALSSLRHQWEKWGEPMDKMRRGLDSAHKAFEDLSGPRTRQFERSLEKLEAFRDGDGDTDGLPALRSVI